MSEKKFQYVEHMFMGLPDEYSSRKATYYILLDCVTCHKTF